MKKITTTVLFFLMTIALAHRMAPIRNVPIVKMRLSDFDEIFMSMAKSELFTGVGGNGEKQWEELTQEKWLSSESENLQSPYLLCEKKLSNASGDKRLSFLYNIIEQVEEGKVAKTTQKQIRSRNKFGKDLNTMNPKLLEEEPIIPIDALYDSDDMSCFVVSLSKYVALEMSKCCNTSEADNKGSRDNCVIQPMLSVMKIARGTVESALAVMNDSPPKLKVNVKLSPRGRGHHGGSYQFCKTPSNGIDYQQILDSIEQRSCEICQEQLGEALPKTSSLLAGCDAQKFTSSQISISEENDENKLFELNNSISFVIDLEASTFDPSVALVDPILIFITGLAALPIVQSVHIEDVSIQKVWK